MPSSSISNGLDTGLLELAESARSLPHSAYRIPSSSTKTVAPATSRKSLKRLLKKNANTTIGKAKWCKNKLKQVQDKVNRLQKRIETLLERTQSLFITLEQMERGSKEIILTRQRLVRIRTG
jgi:flagellar capping protein FliD